MKSLLRILVMAFLVIGAVAVYLILDNNRAAPNPTQEELTLHLNKAIKWVDTHRDMLLGDENTMLWWMLDRSATLTKDPVLTTLVAEFKHRYSEAHSRSIWTHLLDPDSNVPAPMFIPSSWSYYLSYFVYGLTCDRDLGKQEMVAAQSQSDFCLRHHPLSPACVTHQLMGARFVQQNHCDDPTDTKNLIQSLQDTLVTQLTYDPRLVDVYLQRVLMLIESGAASRVKPRWLQRTLEAQRADGGWGPQLLLPIGGQRYLCLTSSAIKFCNLNSDFHSTAQGIFLLSLLTFDTTH